MTDLISTKNRGTYLCLAAINRTVPIIVSPSDWPGVRRAAGDLAADFARVTGTPASLLYTPEKATAPGQGATAILAGTLGINSLIDALAASGKIDGAALAKRSEAYLIQTVENPIPGFERALVIAGSDKRGTIYGIYELSLLIGVSPWYWWADVPARKSAELWADPDCVLSDSPGVRYRGIFLNDEYPALTNWVRDKYGDAKIRTDPPVPPHIANYGCEFYRRVFELLLRLKANYLWPAMWNNAFNEDDGANAALADEYGIIMGTSHQEPMLRAQKEWDRRHGASLGKWNYAKHPETLEKFWREGLERNGDFESIVTLGLRGADDTEMSDEGHLANRKLLEKIIDRQRKIIADTSGKSADRTPQLWCLYKEVQEYYEDGMRVPEDVTLLWSDDNWGNQRRLPTAAERERAGGSGIYYHFDYHGGPRSYQWTNTTPIAKIWDQMTLAREYGADRIWIVNVGHLKGYEYPLSFFMDLAWAPESFSGSSPGRYGRSWAARLFGEEMAGEAADILDTCVRYNARRKPELLSPDAWSLINYGEADRIAGGWDALEKRAGLLYASCPALSRDALYQLILFPVRASALVNGIYVASGKNALWAGQGRTAANAEREKALTLFDSFERLAADYNTDFAGGKWAHFMDQSVLGYTGWADPPRNTIDHIPLRTVEAQSTPVMGIAVEGSPLAWPDGKTLPALPSFCRYGIESHWLEIFNRGTGGFSYTVIPSDPWILADIFSGTVSDCARISISIDWALVPPGSAGGTLAVSGTGKTVTVAVALREAETSEAPKAGLFAETDFYLAIEAAHYTLNVPSGKSRWELIEGFGKTLSGMRAQAGSKAIPPQVESGMPCLEYTAWFYHTGKARVILCVSPALNCFPGESVRIGVSIDGGEVDILTVVEADYRVTNENGDWAKSVSDSGRSVESAQCIPAPGAHTVKVWMLSPGLVLERVIVDLGGLRPSRLGPEESLRAP